MSLRSQRRGFRDVHFEASRPLPSLRLRGFTNERSEFLMTTLPVTDLAQAISGPTVISHFADGGGWRSRLILINPTDASLAGSGRVSGLRRKTDSTFAYSISPRSATTLQTPGDANTTRVARCASFLMPDKGRRKNTGLFVHSCGSDVTAASIPATQPSRTQRTFVEALAGTETGLAIANTSAAAATVTLALANASGKDLGLNAVLNLPASGSEGLFLRRFPNSRPLRFRLEDCLRVSSGALV